jgi:hypothetical protein
MKRYEVKAVNVCERGNIQELLPKRSEIYFGELES